MNIISRWKKNGLVWNFLETSAVETSDHTNKYLHHPNTQFHNETAIVYTEEEVQY